jgi:hypothetical protein
MTLEPAKRYRVTNVSHGRFLNPRVRIGSLCELDSVFQYDRERVAVLVFPSLWEDTVKRDGDKLCREYVALSRGPENWLEPAV